MLLERVAAALTVQAAVRPVLRRGTGRALAAAGPAATAIRPRLSSGKRREHPRLRNGRKCLRRVVLAWLLCPECAWIVHARRALDMDHGRARRQPHAGRSKGRAPAGRVRERRPMSDRQGRPDPYGMPLDRRRMAADAPGDPGAGLEILVSGAIRRQRNRDRPLHADLAEASPMPHRVRRLGFRTGSVMPFRRAAPAVQDTAT